MKCPEKFQLYQIQNGQLAAIIDFNMRNIGKTVPDMWTITYNTICDFRVGFALQKCQLDQNICNIYCKLC